MRISYASAVEMVGWGGCAVGRKDDSLERQDRASFVLFNSFWVVRCDDRLVFISSRSYWLDDH